jgi:hypothetical protein
VTERSGYVTFVLCTLTMLCHASTAKAQGAAPETAPPLFPGGGLVSSDSVVMTRALMPGASERIPVTARPTFSQESDVI